MTGWITVRHVIHVYIIVNVLTRVHSRLQSMFPAFEGLHDDLKNFALRRSQPKLLMEKERQSEREYTIVSI